MIKTQNLVPEVYYNHSRDFQLLGHLYELIFNYIKTNIDVINNIRLLDQTVVEMLDLLTATLGFKKLHEYDVKQLSGLCSIFSEILKCKGTKRSIELVIQMLLNIEGINAMYEVNVSDIDEDYVITIQIPPQLKNLSLLYDVLDYILPAGISCSIIRLDILTLGKNNPYDIFTEVDAPERSEYDGDYYNSVLRSEVQEWSNGPFDTANSDPRNDNALIPQYEQQGD